MKHFWKSPYNLAITERNLESKKKKKKKSKYKNIKDLKNSGEGKHFVVVVVVAWPNYLNPSIDGKLKPHFTAFISE